MPVAAAAVVAVVDDCGGVLMTKWCLHGQVVPSWPGGVMVTWWCLRSAVASWASSGILGNSWRHWEAVAAWEIRGVIVHIVAQIYSENQYYRDRTHKYAIRIDSGHKTSC